jgi:uncharacterized oxidoreductase
MKPYGNTVLVVDGTEGFQFELARAFAVYGNHVIICSDDRQKLESVRNRLTRIRTYQARVSNRAQRTALFELLSHHHPNLNVLVNCEKLCSCLDQAGEPQSGSRGSHGTGSMANVVATEFLSYFGGKGNTAILNVCGASLGRSCPHTAKLQRMLQKTEVSVIEVVPPSRFSRLLGRLLVPSPASENRDVRSMVEALANGKPRVFGELDSRYLYKAACFFENWLPSRVPAAPRT